MASWRQVYGRDLVMDLWGPERLSKLEASAMMDGLPSTCATWRELQGTGPFHYGYAEQLAELILGSEERSRFIHHEIRNTYIKKGRPRPSFEALKHERPWIVVEPEPIPEMDLAFFESLTAKIEGQLNA